MAEVHLSARCFPTEDRAKVIGSITSAFPDAVISGEDPIEASASSTDMFAELLKRQRIRDAARAVLRRGVRGNMTRFRLNKQVAAIGKMSFSEEDHPLGDIEVTIVSDDIAAVIDSIAPNTRLERGA
ncbi:MAG: hypothetical protein MUC90_00445 [Thermoplasmata archaeon]|nr:hypothetical protein [Thermoplasmata archaeon]